MDDGFYAGLCDVHLQTEAYMQKEIRRLRLENASLMATIAQGPSTLTELQDRITLLEQCLAESNAPNERSE